MDDPFESTPWPPGATREEIVRLMLADLERLTVFCSARNTKLTSELHAELKRVDSLLGYFEEVLTAEDHFKEALIAGASVSASSNTTQREPHPLLDGSDASFPAGESIPAGLPGTEKSPLAHPEPEA